MGSSTGAGSRATLRVFALITREDELAAKSTPRDGSHGRGVKGGRSGTGGALTSPLQFLRDLVRGLKGLRRL